MTFISIVSEDKAESTKVSAKSNVLNAVFFTFLFLFTNFAIGQPSAIENTIEFDNAVVCVVVSCVST